MLRIALRMLAADRAKFGGLLFGLAFTAFLVTFAAAYFAGFMTHGFALVSENPGFDIWVMDPAVDSVEQTTNLPASALARVRSVDGVADARPLSLATADARFPNGRFQQFQVIAVDDATLAGAPAVDGVAGQALRSPDAVIVDAGGTSGKLDTPTLARDRWPHDGPHLQVPMRELAAGDELLVNDQRVRVLGQSHVPQRFPPRPLMYMTQGTALRLLPPERRTLTFVLVRAAEGLDANHLADRITARTGLRARTRAQFKSDTVRWYLINSEDVGDITAMLVLAMTMGLGVSGVMFFMFTLDSRRHYAVLKALGADPATLRNMVIVQVLVSALIGAGVGLGVCAAAVLLAVHANFPVRMMWFTPIIGVLGVGLVSAVAAWASLRPVARLEPGAVFAGR